MTFAHEFDHALQDQTLPIFTDQDDVLDQSDRILARQAAYEGDATLLMTHWAIENLTPEELQERRRRRRRPRAGRPSSSGSRRSCARRCSSRTRRALAFVAAEPDRRRLGGRRRALRPPARVDRADPPSREVRTPTRRRSRSTCPTTSPTRLGNGLDRPARGHVRRVPDAGLAARGRRRRPRRPTSGGRLGRRSPGGARRPDRRVGRRLADRLGQPGATRPSSRPPPRPHWPRPAGRRGSSPARAGRPAGS